MWLRRLRSPWICIWQVGTQEEPMFQFSVWIQRQGKTEVPAWSNEATGLQLNGRDPHTLRMLLRYSVYWFWFKCSCCFCSVAQSCLTLCNPMDCSTPGFPVLHHIPELAQTHVHGVSDAIQPSHPVIPFSSCVQSFPASGSFLMSWLFASGGQSIGASASASVIPVNIQDWLPLGLTGWISSQSKGLSRVFNTTVQKHQFFGAHLSSGSNSHPYMTTGKTKALTIQTFVGKVMSLLFNMLSRLIIAFLPRSKHLLISWLPSASAVILEPKKIKVCHCFHWFKC